jgi:BlaI family penicillinase repressor
MVIGQIKPTESELEILQILWSMGEASVKEINEILNQVRVVGYTTTLKIMQLMHSKGLLIREIEGKKHIYTAVVKEESIQRKMLDKFITGTFKGSAYKLVMEALGNHRASEEELKSIKELIAQIEGGKK